jgi:hypothetical protein
MSVDDVHAKTDQRNAAGKYSGDYGNDSFQAVLDDVKYSRRFPRQASSWRSATSTMGMRVSGIFDEGSVRGAGLSSPRLSASR